MTPTPRLSASSPVTNPGLARWPGAAQSGHSEAGGSTVPEECRRQRKTLSSEKLSWTDLLPAATDRRPKCRLARPQATKWQNRRKAEGWSRSTGQGDMALTLWPPAVCSPPAPQETTPVSRPRQGEGQDGPQSWSGVWLSHGHTSPAATELAVQRPPARPAS